jgi:hypothetical protein
VRVSELTRTVNSVLMAVQIDTTLLVKVNFFRYFCELLAASSVGLPEL